MAAWISGDALVALTAAASWGGGDFSGGMAVKAAGGSTRGALRVVLVAYGASLAGILIMLAISAGKPAAPPGAVLVAWGLAAGVAAAVALSALYLALARGAMGASAAVCGLLGAAIPAMVSRVLEGTPNTLQTAGFGLAAAAIWIIAAASPADPRRLEVPSGTAIGQRSTLALAVLAGVGFGLYFVALRMDNALGVLQSLALARIASLLTCGLVLAALSLANSRSHGAVPPTAGRAAVQGPARTGERNGPRQLSRKAVSWALGVALLDTGGDLLFVQATRLGRLDVAAVLTSLYPAGTILLAAWVLRERPTKRQAAGMAVAMLAVVLIVL